MIHVLSKEIKASTLLLTEIEGPRQQAKQQASLSKFVIIQTPKKMCVCVCIYMSFWVKYTHAQ